MCGFRSDELPDVSRLAVKFITIVANEGLECWYVSCSGLFGPHSIGLRSSFLTNCRSGKKNEQQKQKREATSGESHICLRCCNTFRTNFFTPPERVVLHCQHIFSEPQSLRYFG